MNPEEQGTMLSAYLDDELDGEQRAEVEAMLQKDAELTNQLEGMKDLGVVLNRALDEEAANIDFRTMRETVLREVSEITPIGERVDTAQNETRLGFWETLRAFVERPAVAFALGLMVAGVWTSFNPMVQAPGGASDVPAQPAMTAENLPAAAMRGPEAEQSFSKASPSLVLETLSVENGKVVLDRKGDDPDAPVVLWHFSESSADGEESDAQQRPAAPEPASMKEGDPL